MTTPDQTAANTRLAPDAEACFKRALRGTWLGLWAENLVRAFWPLTTLVLFLVTALGFGLQDVLSPLWSSIVFGALILGIIVAMLLGTWRLNVPDRIAALRRLDASMAGRPLSSLADEQLVGLGDRASQEVWQAHLARQRAQLAKASPVSGDTRLSRYDRFGLRYVALTGAVAAVVFGAPVRVVELTEVAQLPGRAEAVALGPSWEAWVQPPSYTGRPSLYLNDVNRTSLQLPQGSRVTTRFYGQEGVMTLHESLSQRDEFNPAEMAQDFEIERSGRLSVRGPGGRDWEVVAQIDQPPSITLIGLPERERGGMMSQQFRAQDDYGVTGGDVQLELDLDNVERRYGLATDPEPRAPLTLPLPMPVSGARDDITDALVEDFSQHPWANLPVRIAFSVEDARGQTGNAEPLHATLPGRRFFDPMAASVIELRRDILWSRDNAERAGDLMRALSHRGKDAFRNDTARRRFLDTRDTLLASLGDPDGLNAATRDDIAAKMWELAILLEEGELGDARERLRRAQERLDEAVRNGADPSEIQELMDELREAMRDYIRQLAEQPRERGEAPADGESMEITQDQIQELMDRIQELMEEGRMDEAAELLAQLNALLENLQVAEGQGGEGSGMPGSEAMEGLGEALRDQQNLADDTFREFQEQFRDDGRPQPSPDRQDAPGADEPDADGQGDEPGQDQADGAETAPNGAPDVPGLAERQRALGEQLRQQQLQPLPGEGTAEGDAALEALERAQRNMEAAEEALREGDSGEALSRQADAIEAMRDGLRAMNEANTQEARERGLGDPDDASGPDGGRDPLGRDRSAGGEVGTDDNLLQGEDVYRRAQDLLEELRRRSAELERPEAELDYLRRLLDRF